MNQKGFCSVPIELITAVSRRPTPIHPQRHRRECELIPSPALLLCPTLLLLCKFFPPSTGLASSGQPGPSAKLAHFIAHARHRARLAPCVVFVALFFLQRLKNRIPAAQGSSGHCLLISAFMIASKVVCNDTYSNKLVLGRCGSRYAPS